MHWEKLRNSMHAMQISLYSSDPTQKVQQVHSLSIDIEEAIVYAYADALASVSYVYDQHSCYAFGDTTGCIITEEHPFGFCVGCQVGAVSYGAISEINAISEACAILLSYVHFSERTQFCFDADALLIPAV